MRHYIFFLTLISNLAVAKPVLINEKDFKEYKPSAHNSTTHYLTKSKAKLNLKQTQGRSIDYPTQIVRLKFDFSKFNVTCEEIYQSMTQLLINNLEHKDITYAGGSACWASVNGTTPNNFKFDFYFDPQTDEAVAYLQQYIANYDGIDFYGVPFKIEPAKGVVVWLDAKAGIEENSESSNFKTLYRLNGRIYFNSMYDIDHTLSDDIENKMLTNNPFLITSFINRWMGSGDATNETSEYLQNLSNSNMVIISPEYIFLMDSEPRAHSPSVHTTYSHKCKDYPSGKCLADY